MSASAESILEQYPSTLNRRPHRQRTYIKRTTARLYRQLFRRPHSTPPHHRIYINTVVAESPPLPPRPSNGRTQQKTMRTRRTIPFSLSAFPSHFPPPFIPASFAPPETTRQNGIGYLPRAYHTTGCHLLTSHSPHLPNPILPPQPMFMVYKLWTSPPSPDRDRWHHPTRLLCNPPPHSINPHPLSPSAKQRTSRQQSHYKNRDGDSPPKSRR